MNRNHQRAYSTTWETHPFSQIPHQSPNFSYIYIYISSLQIRLPAARDSKLTSSPQWQHPCLHHHQSTPWQQIDIRFHWQHFPPGEYGNTWRTRRSLRKKTGRFEQHTTYPTMVKDHRTIGRHVEAQGVWFRLHQYCWDCPFNSGYQCLSSEKFDCC